MFDQARNKIIAVVLGAIVTTAGYGALYLADNRYVQQKQWIAEKRQSERREIQYRIDKLEWKKANANLTSQEDWELRRLKTELRELQ